MWCTCIAAVQINGEKIEYAQLGDCMIVAILQNGTMQVVTKDTVKGISKRAKRREKKIVKRFICARRTCFSRCSRTVKIQSLSCKYGGGYSVANGMKEAIHYLQHGELHIDEVSGIFICSDGLFHPDWSLEQTVAYIRKNSINEYVAIIEELEGEKRIRPDDKTIIMIDF